MTSNAINSVLYNVDQRADTTDLEKATARANIAAQGELVAGPNIDIYGSIVSTEKVRVEAGANVSVSSSLDPQTRVITYTVSAAGSQGGAKRSHTAELYFYDHDTGDNYHVRNIKNYCINHVAVENHYSDMCSVVIEAPTLATGEEYDYVVVFDCVNSSGSCNVSVENCDPEIEIKWEVDTTAVPMKTFAIDVSYTEVSWTGSPQYQIEVIGGRWQRHRF